MKQLLGYLVNSNLLISFCAVAFVQTGACLLQLGYLSLRPLVLVFNATFLIYNLSIFLVQLLRKERLEQGGKLSWFNKHKKGMMGLLGLNLLLLLISFPYHSWKESLFFLQLGAISLAYNVPDRYAQTAFRSIRTIPLLKVFLIAYVWASIGAFYPALLHQDLTAQTFLLFGLFFCFILAITLPFDIRDYFGDRRLKLLTVPGVIGIKATKGLSCGLMLLYSLSLAWFFGEPFAAILLWVVATALILASSAKSPDWYFTGYIDSLLLLHFFLIV